MADWLSSLEGSTRNAAAALVALFKSYGLDSLAPRVIQMIQDGEGQDTITLRLQETPEYKKRFAGNEARLRAGKPVLSPAEYISLENSYRQVMSLGGLPTGFYDQTSDFQKFIENDMSPTEVQSRVQNAKDLLYSADAETLRFYQQHYTDGEMIASILDPKIATPLIEKRVAAAHAAGAAANNGIGLSTKQAEAIATTGASDSAMRQGFAAIGQDLPTLDKLAQMNGGQFTVDQAIGAAFLGDGQAAQAAGRLASQERGRFSASSAQQQHSLSRADAGSS